MRCTFIGQINEYCLILKDEKMKDENKEKVS